MAITLRGLLESRGYSYMSVFSSHAEDIYFDSVEDLCFSIGYILKYLHSIDAEIPVRRAQVINSILPNYPITENITSGGHQMKRAPQYRIYFRTVRNMPYELQQRLQNDNRMRITGSYFVEACMYLGFDPGSSYNQDYDLINAALDEIFYNPSEQNALQNGYSQ